MDIGVKNMGEYEAAKEKFLRGQIGWTSLLKIIDKENENINNKLIELKKSLDEAWLSNNMSYDTQGVNWVHNQLAILVDPEPPKETDNG